MDIEIHLDEAGDLGWSFQQPYLQGGSSRYLTIASVSAPVEKRHLLRRIIKKLRKEFHWSNIKEKKWANMAPLSKLRFAEKALGLANREATITYHAITVKKQNVEEHIRTDANKLYNYMIQLSLLNHMSKYERVYFYPDPRTIKVESGNSLHDYLQTQLWMEKKVKTELITEPTDSSNNTLIQYADMLAGLVQSHHENNNSDPWKVLRPKINCKVLFF